MIPDLGTDGQMPRGRFVATLDEVEERFVAAPEFETSATRVQIWSDFLDVLELVQKRKVDIPAAFVGGTFVSAKLDPSDIDSSIIVDVTGPDVTPPTLGVLQKLVHRDGLARRNLKVDAFIQPWHPNGQQYGGDPGFMTIRGAWDDWWQRDVAKSERLNPVREHALPRRGYLEVIVDGYK